MSGPSGRMLELLSLLQSGRAWSAAPLAERLGTSPRTLRRDIDRLRKLGYPVSSIRGPGGSYRLEAGRAMPPLILTDEEAVATAIGLRLASFLHHDAPHSKINPDGKIITDGNDAADMALHKIELVLPSRLRYRLEALSAATDSVQRRGAGADLFVMQALATAAHAHHDVRFDYRDQAAVASERRAEPYRMVLLGRNWYLLGWDRDRLDWRTFRVDRISDLVVPGTTFHPRALPEDGSASFVQQIRQAPLSSHPGSIRFTAPLEVVAERLRAEAGSLEVIDETHCRYRSATDSWEWLASAAAAVGVPYVIEGPPELIVASRELLARVAAAVMSITDQPDA